MLGLHTWAQGHLHAASARLPIPEDMATSFGGEKWQKVVDNICTSGGVVVMFL